VTNKAGATIYASALFAGGVYNKSSYSTTIVNYGNIVASGVYFADGVFLRSSGGGEVHNETSGEISGIIGVYINGAGTVTNAGTIAASSSIYSAVELNDGGSVTNLAGGAINGLGGSIAMGAAGTVTNAGALESGVFLQSGGKVTNQAGGTIGSGTYGYAVLLSAGGTVVNTGEISGKGGIVAEGRAASVTNGGSIAGTTVGTSTVGGVTVTLGDGVRLEAGGAVANNAGGTITGAADGVYVAGGGTVTNAGTISGTIASVEFAGSGANTLTLETGSTLNGDAIGSTASGATNALVLQGHGTANNNFDNFNTLDVQANGNWTLGGDSTFGATTVSSGSLIVAGDVSGGATTLGDPAGDVATLVIASTGTWDILDDSGIGLGGPAPSSILNSGLFEKTGGGGTSAIAPQLVNNGSILVSSGALDLERAVSGNGADTVSGASTLEFDSTVGGGQTAGFNGGGGALDLIDPLGFAAKISGFAATDKVELSGDWVFSHFSETGNGTIGTLTLMSGAAQLSLRFLGDYTASDFTVASGATTIITHA
jgi:hypothetical protein